MATGQDVVDQDVAVGGQRGEDAPLAELEEGRRGNSEDNWKKIGGKTVKERKITRMIPQSRSFVVRPW